MSVRKRKRNGENRKFLAVYPGNDYRRSMWSANGAERKLESLRREGYRERHKPPTLKYPCTIEMVCSECDPKAPFCFRFRYPFGRGAEIGAESPEVSGVDVRGGELAVSTEKLYRDNQCPTDDDISEITAESPEVSGVDVRGGEVCIDKLYRDNPCPTNDDIIFLAGSEDVQHSTHFTAHGRGAPRPQSELGSRSRRALPVFVKQLIERKIGAGRTFKTIMVDIERILYVDAAWIPFIDVVTKERVKDYIKTLNRKKNSKRPILVQK